MLHLAGKRTVGPPFESIRGNALLRPTAYPLSPGRCITAAQGAVLHTQEFLLALIVIFVTAKLFGELAERIGQPAVLGEMIGGIVVGASGLRLIDPSAPILHVMAEVGIIMLLFLIGLETDVSTLISVGPAAAAVAIVGVVLPLIGGTAIGVMLGYSSAVALFLGAALTATSVGITARVLSDLGHLKSNEGQVIVGAAVVDDILGLVLLTIVGGLAAGRELSAFVIGKSFLAAIGFVLLALIIGSWIAPLLLRFVARLRVAKALFFASIVFAFLLAYIADIVGSGRIIGAFTAGVVLARTKQASDVELEVFDIAQFFVPLFFVLVGAAVDLRTVNPFAPQTRTFFLVGLLLTVVGTAGKVAAGFAAFGTKVKRLIVGVGMVPRGEVGLVFAQIGLATGVLTSGLYSSVALMVILTTFMTPPLLRRLLVPGAKEEMPLVCEVVTETISDRQRREQKN
jgi:Kef-type K+ transport system membrane component KefB